MCTIKIGLFCIERISDVSHHILLQCSLYIVTRLHAKLWGQAFVDEDYTQGAFKPGVDYSDTAMCSISVMTNGGISLTVNTINVRGCLP